MKKRTPLSLLCLLLLLFKSYGQQPIFKGEATATKTISFRNDSQLEKRTAFSLEKEGITSNDTELYQPELVLKPFKIPLKKPKPFLSTYSVWSGQHLDHTTTTLHYRTSKNGKSWSGWKQAVFDGHQEQSSDRIVSKMVFLDAKVRYIQYKLVLAKGSSATRIQSAEIFHYSPGDTPRKIKKQLKASAKNAVAAGCSKPSVVSRSQWGATFRNPAASSTVSHLIVHHEFGSNSSSDWAARVRAVQNFHINGNGWSDIGYNFLVDPNGVIYEGRAGGDNAIGAHFCGTNRNTMGVCMMGDYSSVTPTNATQQALKNLLAWKADKDNINPEGASFHYSVNRSLTHIAGHRDAGCSVCPGNGGYGILPGLRSDVGALVSNGCSVAPSPTADTVPPTTAIDAPAETVQTGDFTVTFSDNDNVGVTRRFYQVLEQYGSGFLANRNNGFFNENFNQDNGVYDIGAGNWSITDQRLKQSDIVSDNTLWSSYLIQDSDLPYLYEFSAKVTSTTGPRKFGIHIMASDRTLPQRGDSYLIWFSGEDNKVRIYETDNDVLNFRAISDVSLDNDWAKYRVTYSPAYGVVRVWKNNTLLLSWTDTSPIRTGGAISLRTNKTAITFDDLKVYHYRAGSSAVVSAGVESNKDLRTTTGKIKSMVRDEAGNWSVAGNLDVTTNFGASLTANTNQLLLYPNAVTHTAMLRWEQPRSGAVSVAIYDLQGKQVVQTTSQISKGNKQLDISSDIATLPPGVYMVNLSSEWHNETIKMVKQ